MSLWGSGQRRKLANWLNLKIGIFWTYAGEHRERHLIDTSAGQLYFLCAERNGALSALNGHTGREKNKSASKSLHRALTGHVSYERTARCPQKQRQRKHIRPERPKQCGTSWERYKRRLRKVRAPFSLFLSARFSLAYAAGHTRLWNTKAPTSLVFAAHPLFGVVLSIALIESPPPSQ